MDLYSNVIPLTGSFHKLPVFQRILFNHYGCLGFQNWFVDSGTATTGTLNQCFEGSHYFSLIRLHKETFDAILQIKVNDITNIPEKSIKEQTTSI